MDEPKKYYANSDTNDNNSQKFTDSNLEEDIKLLRKVRENFKNNLKSSDTKPIISDDFIDSVFDEVERNQTKKLTENTNQKE